METMENNLPSAAHQEKARKMKKLRSLADCYQPSWSGYYIWGVIEVICLF